MAVLASVSFGGCSGFASERNLYVGAHNDLHDCKLTQTCLKHGKY